MYMQCISLSKNKQTNPSYKKTEKIVLGSNHKKLTIHLIWKHNTIQISTNKCLPLPVKNSTLQVLHLRMLSELKKIWVSIML